MVQPVVSFGPRDPLKRAMTIMLRRGFSGAPVTDAEGRVLGILSEFDCMRLLAEGSFHHQPDILAVLVGDVMSAPVATATPDMDLFAVVHRLLNAAVRRLPVLEADRLVGIVSRRDALGAIHRYFG